MELTSEGILLQNEFRKFSQQVILDKVDEIDKNGKFPDEIIKKLAQTGLLGAVIPEDMGGGALDSIGIIVSLEEISKVSPAIGLIIATHNALFSYPILKFGSDDLKKKYLPGAATGEIIGGVANYETNEFQLKKVEENYILSGNNPFVLNLEVAGSVITTLPDSQTNERLRIFLLDDITGMERICENSCLGMRGSGIGKLVLKDVVVPKENIIDINCLDEIYDFARICLASIAVGIAQGALDAAIKYARERVQFGEAIINFGMLREKIAEMATKIEAARLLTYDAALKMDAGKEFRQSAAMAKYFAAQAAVEITTSAIQIYGGYGYMKDYPTQRYFRDAQVINVLCLAPIQTRELIAKLTIG